MQTYVSVTHEMGTTGIYAGIDCCCSAGSIAISNEPLSRQISAYRMSSGCVRYVAGCAAGCAAVSSAFIAIVPGSE